MSKENQSKNTGVGEKSGPNSPAEKAGIGWEMPAPIFRVSEGVPVKKRDPDSIPIVKTPEPHPPLPDAPPAMAQAIDAAEETGSNEPVENPLPPEKPATSIVGILMTAAGIVGMILFVVVLIGLLYFYFVYKRDPASGS